MKKMPTVFCEKVLTFREVSDTLCGNTPMIHSVLYKNLKESEVIIMFAVMNMKYTNEYRMMTSVFTC